VTLDWLPALMGLVLGGGVVGGYVALRKLPPERDQIIVAAAKEVVVIQRETLDDVRQQVAGLEARLNQQAATARLALEECHAERDELRIARRGDLVRLSELERLVAELRG
jgi:paraquat-inducible protein B